MIKSELTQALSDYRGISYRAAERIVNEIFDGMFEELAGGGRIEIRGFGSFTNRHYDTYQGRNPKTGEIITVRPKKIAFFKVGKELRESLAQSTDTEPPAPTNVRSEEGN